MLCCHYYWYEKLFLFLSLFLFVAVCLSRHQKQGWSEKDELKQVKLKEAAMEMTRGDLCKENHCRDDPIQMELSLRRKIQSNNGGKSCHRQSFSHKWPHNLWGQRWSQSWSQAKLGMCKANLLQEGKLSRVGPRVSGCWCRGEKYWGQDWIQAEWSKVNLNKSQSQNHS